ncbi:hypothetical protein C1645_818538, partial [Glomus cerebriforme]
MAYRLNSDCLYKIFEYLDDDKPNLYSCLLVDHYWCNLSVRILWRNFWKFEYLTEDSFEEILNTLVACLSGRSQWLLYKNGIIISSKKPLFNYINFSEVPSTYEVYQFIHKGLKNKPITLLSIEDRNCLVINEIFKFLNLPNNLNFTCFGKLFLCAKCKSLTKFFEWCNNCKLNHFRLNYGEHPSGNNEIDGILKNNYCKSESSDELIEWIPYNKFENIKINDREISAIWSSGNTCCWNKWSYDWGRRKNSMVTLYNFEKLDDLFDTYGIELKYSMFDEEIYGISKDPISLKYILATQYNFEKLFLCAK